MDDDSEGISLAASFFWVEEYSRVAISPDEEDVRDPSFGSVFFGDHVLQDAASVEGVHALAAAWGGPGSYNDNPSFARWAASAVLNHDAGVFREELDIVAHRRQSEDVAREDVGREAEFRKFDAGFQ